MIIYYDFDMNEQYASECRIRNIMKEIVSSLYNGVHLTPFLLINGYHHELHNEVHEAMWRLIDDGVLSINPDYDLSLRK